MLWTSGFVDDIMFSHNGPYGASCVYLSLLIYYHVMCTLVCIRRVRRRNCQNLYGRCATYDKKSQINLGRASSPPFAAENNYATKSPLVTIGCLTFTTKLFLPFWRSPPHLIHISHDRTHPPPQTASRSNQPFCHSTPFWPTDRPTDGIGDRSVPRAAYACCIATRLESERSNWEVRSSC